MTPYDLSTHLRALGFVRVNKTARAGRTGEMNGRLNISAAAKEIGVHRETLSAYLNGTAKIKPIIHSSIRQAYARRKQRSKT